MVSYEDKEMTLLLDTVEKAENKYSTKLTPKTIKIIKIVEKFISDNELICYGGIAINNILPKKAHFYSGSEFPDYDFFSPNALMHAKKLANIYAKKGYVNVEAKSGVHYGTYKIFVNFLNIADITEIEPEYYTNLKKKAIKKDKILYSPPDFLRMSMYLELSRPKGDTSRWEKILTRLKLLNKYYPLRSDKCMKDMEPLQTDIYESVKKQLLSEKVIFFGGFADTLYSKYSKKKHNISKHMTMDVLSKDAKKVSNSLKKNISDVSIKHIENIGHRIPEHYSITINNKVYANIYQSEACYTYNKINIQNKTYNIATIFTMLSLYLIFIFTDREYYDTNRIMCTANMLQKLYEKHHLQKKGILRIYTIDCIGNQETLEDLLLLKRKAYKGIKRQDSNYEKWFLRYSPKNK